MKNALFYYYHLYPEFIIKKQGKCIFNLEDLSYQLTPCDKRRRRIRGDRELKCLFKRRKISEDCPQYFWAASKFHRKS